MDNLRYFWIYRDGIPLVAWHMAGCSPEASQFGNCSLSRILLASNAYLALGSCTDSPWANGIPEDALGIAGASGKCGRSWCTPSNDWDNTAGSTWSVFMQVCCHSQTPYFFFSSLVGAIGFLQPLWMFASVHLPRSVSTFPGLCSANDSRELSESQDSLETVYPYPGTNTGARTCITYRVDALN